MQSLLDWRKSAQIAIQSDTQGVAKMAYEDCLGKEVFIGHCGMP